MISFCQDLTISYEYHVYENKTIKKISHKRNGSNISEKTFIKSNKLQVVSKNRNPSKPENSAKGIGLVEPEKKIPQHLKDKAGHRRTMSNQVENRTRLEVSQNFEEVEYVHKEGPLSQMKQARSIQIPQTASQQRVYINRPDLRIYEQPPMSTYKKFTQISATKPIAHYKQKVNFFCRQPKSFEGKESLEQKTVRLKQSIQKFDQNQSVQTKGYNWKGFEKNNSDVKNLSQAQSFRSYDTVVRMNDNGKVVKSLIQKLDQSEQQHQKQQYHPKKINLMNFMTPQSTKNQQSSIYSFTNPEITIYPKHQPQPNQPFSSLQHKVLFPPQSPQQQNSQDHSILFDATSILSKDINQQQLDQIESVVEQRNFFFQKEQQPEQVFKKSIDKFVFYDPGYLSINKKWTLFKNVQDKQTKRIYSIKEFSTQHQKEYFNEYDIYLELKIDTAHTSGNDNSSHDVFLHLFNALSNTQQKKLHLIKQTFQFTLADYIDHFKQSNAFSINSRNILMTQKAKIQIEIAKIMQFFTSRQISLRIGENLEIQDFVVCQMANQQYMIKFHSLHKLEKQSIQTVKIKICNNLNNTSKVASHKADKWCFYHACQYDLQIQEKSLAEQQFSSNITKKNLNKEKLMILSKKLDKQFFNK